MNTLGERIQDYGVKRGFPTIREYAKALDLPESTLQSYIKNRRSAGTPFYLAMYQIGCDLNWLIAGESGSSFLNYLESDKNSRLFRLMEENKSLKDIIRNAQKVLSWKVPEEKT